MGDICRSVIKMKGWMVLIEYLSSDTMTVGIIKGEITTKLLIESMIIY